MNKFADFTILTDVVRPIYENIEQLVYWKLLPVAFVLAIVFIYFKAPWGSPEFLDCIKRLVITVLLLIAFPEIQKMITDVAGLISEHISGDQTGFFKEFFTKGVESSKAGLIKGSLLNFSNLITSCLSFLCWCIAYVASYLMIAMRQFMWLTLTALAPLLILCNLFPGTSNITKGLFTSLVELSCWEIYWRILEKILHALGYIETIGPDEWFLTLALTVVVTVTMISTPKVVKTILGGSYIAASPTLQAAAVATPIAAVRKAKAAKQFLQKKFSSKSGRPDTSDN